MHIFFIEDHDLLKKYNTIWNKLIADIKKKLDSKPVYNKNFLKNKITSHGNEVTDFYDKKIPKVDSSHTCLFDMVYLIFLYLYISYFYQICHYLM